MPGQLGERLLGVMREIKRTFDPKNLFNPGKILPDGRYRIDTLLRTTGYRERGLPFEPTLAFAFKDESFIGNLEQCNVAAVVAKTRPRCARGSWPRATNTRPLVGGRTRSARRSNCARRVTIRCAPTSWKRR